MEEWLHFIETFSGYIFMGLLSPRAAQLWDLLRRAVRHYFRPWQGNSVKAFRAAAAQAAGCLRQYASSAESWGLADKLFTINLHICVCR